MKYLVLIPDGMADEPIAELANRTPMEAADKPTMDMLVKKSLVGTVLNVPDGMVPESDTANMAILSFDPNLRPPLWKTLDDAKEQVAYGLSKCDVLKISDNEIQWFTGEEDFDAGIAKLREQYNIPLIMLSLGRDGSRAYYKDLRVEVKPFLQDSTIETTGAGDTFGGCCLHYVLKYGLDNLDEEKLTEMLTFANAAASIVTTRKGALRVMPDVEEVEAFIKSRA